MPDRTTIAAIIARHNLTGDRAALVRHAARSTSDTVALERMADLVVGLSDTQVWLMAREAKRARKVARQERKER